MSSGAILGGAPELVTWRLTGRGVTMKDLTTRNVPDTVADGLAEIAREEGMSAEAYRRKMFADAVAEHGYRQLAEDAEYREYQATLRPNRSRRAERRDGDQDIVS